MINARHPSTSLPADLPTLGVEEEFLIVDPNSGSPLPVAQEVIDLARRFGTELEPELTRVQLTSNTPVCHGMRELREHLLGTRSVAAAAALQTGGQLLAVGVSPAGPTGRPLSDADRYQRMGRGYGMLAAEHGVCGCHVHVAVPDRETAVQVGNHLRPWLPALLALTANSPLHQGVDTGYASWRSVLCGRWARSGAPPYFTSAEHYDAVVDRMVDSGAVIDRAMVHWDVRPSEHLPTVEVRVSDVPATVDESCYSPFWCAPSSPPPSGLSTGGGGSPGLRPDRARRLPARGSRRHPRPGCRRVHRPPLSGGTAGVEGAAPRQWGRPAAAGVPAAGTGEGRRGSPGPQHPPGLPAGDDGVVIGDLVIGRTDARTSMWTTRGRAQGPV